MGYLPWTEEEEQILISFAKLFSKNKVSKTEISRIMHRSKESINQKASKLGISFNKDVGIDKEALVKFIESFTGKKCKDPLKELESL